jgi:hypothetical protein
MNFSFSFSFSCAFLLGITFLSQNCRNRALLLPGPYEQWHLPSGIGVSSFEGNPDS